MTILIEEKIATLVCYLKVKLDERDWHGVSDCANDIRVLEGQNGWRKAHASITRLAEDYRQELERYRRAAKPSTEDEVCL
jgi:hypothetical protein